MTGVATRSPLVGLLCDWVRAPESVRDRRQRFRTVYKATAWQWRTLQQTVARVATEAVLAGRMSAADMVAVLDPQLAVYGDSSRFRERGQLYFDVVAELAERGVALGPDPDGGAGDDEGIDLEAVGEPDPEDEGA